MGGLRPGTTTPVCPKRRGAEIRHHWDAVAQASGQAFDYRLLDREDFIYDTDPAAARAVVLALLPPRAGG